MLQASTERPGQPSGEPSRRTFLSLASSVVMVTGAGAGYGTLGVIAGAFLYPARARALAWVYVTELDGMEPGQAIDFRAPGGESVTVARQGTVGTADDFLALASTCPHLGCQVHWEPQNNRFFCPCHKGVFDAQGKATAGPPADAGQSLPRYPLREEDGLLYIQVPVAGLSGAGARAHYNAFQPPRYAVGRGCCKEGDRHLAAAPDISRYEIGSEPVAVFRRTVSAAYGPEVS